MGRDSSLGLGRAITRRDFLDGIAVAIGATLVPSCRPEDGFHPEHDPEYYPPALTGLRGSHDGAFEAAHRLKDGQFWKTAGPAEETGETYDLVVVGGGISGLAAAYFFRGKAGPDARVLVLDNHDDFGGHARRNEFQGRGRLVLGYGGSQSFESPARYSGVAKGLLRDLGVDLSKFEKAFDQKLYPSMGLTPGVFFDKQTFGADRLVAGLGVRAWADLFAESPLAPRLREALAGLYASKTDFLPGLSREAKEKRLAKTSYADFLTKAAGLPAEALPFFQAMPHDAYGVGIDAVSALDCWAGSVFIGGLGETLGYPGFAGMDLEGAGSPELGLTAQLHQSEEPYIYHFPDGNASLARLLVRALVPAAVPGSTMEDVVTARADYSRLDEAGSPARIRLNSTAVRVRHVGDPDSAKEVEVAYVGGRGLRTGRARTGGRSRGLRTVRARACVLACWNGMIPYLCPELPAAQKDALAYGVKVPLVYSHVLVRDWRAWRELGIDQIYAPGGYHTAVSLDFPVSLGAYAFPRAPEQPMMLHMLRTPCRPGLPARDQHRLGRIELLGTPFATFEREIRSQLGRMLGGAGFDPARDVVAITVNRWPHGYAYEYNPLFDPEWPEGEAPCAVGRRRFGRIAIANSDAGASAYVDAAIDQAHRAVTELLS